MERKGENFDSRAKIANALTNEPNNTETTGLVDPGHYFEAFMPEKESIKFSSIDDNPSMLSKFSTGCIKKKQQLTESLSARQSADVSHELGMGQWSSSSQSKERQHKVQQNFTGATFENTEGYYLTLG